MEAMGEIGVVADPSQQQQQQQQQPVGVSKFEIVTKEMEASAVAADGASKKRKLSDDEMDEDAAATHSPKRCKVGSSSDADTSLVTESVFDQNNKSLAERTSFIETVEALSQIDCEDPGSSASSSLGEYPQQTPQLLESDETVAVSGPFPAMSETPPFSTGVVPADQLPRATIGVDPYRERSAPSPPEVTSSSSQLSLSQSTTQEYAIPSQESFSSQGRRETPENSTPPPSRLTGRDNEGESDAVGAAIARQLPDEPRVVLPDHSTSGSLPDLSKPQLHQPSEDRRIRASSQGEELGNDGGMDIPSYGPDSFATLTPSDVQAQFVGECHQGDAQVYQCGVCGFASPDYGLVEKHYVQTHQAIETKQCALCPFFTTNQEEIEYHLRSYHNYHGEVATTSASSSSPHEDCAETVNSRNDGIIAPAQPQLDSTQSRVLDASTASTIVVQDAEGNYVLLPQQQLLQPQGNEFPQQQRENVVARDAALERDDGAPTPQFCHLNSEKYQATNAIVPTRQIPSELPKPVPLESNQQLFQDPNTGLVYSVVPDDDSAAMTFLSANLSGTAVDPNVTSANVDLPPTTGIDSDQVIVTLPDGTLALVETPRGSTTPEEGGQERRSYSAGGPSQELSPQNEALVLSTDVPPTCGVTDASTGAIFSSAAEGSNLVLSDESGRTYVVEGNALIASTNLLPSQDLSAAAVAQKPDSEAAERKQIGAGVVFDDPDFRCENCSYFADNLLYMNQHVMMRHPEAANPPGALSGALSGSGKTTSSLKRCAFCHMAYRTLTKLKEHLDTKHAPVSIKEKSEGRNRSGVRQGNNDNKYDPVECKLCGAEILKMSAMYRHLLQAHKLVIITDDGGSEAVVEASKWWSLQEQFRNAKDKDLQAELQRTMQAMRLSQPASLVIKRKSLPASNAVAEGESSLAKAASSFASASSAGGDPSSTVAKLGVTRGQSAFRFATTVDISNTQTPRQRATDGAVVVEGNITTPSVTKRRVQPAVLGKRRVSSMATPVSAISAQARISRPIAPASSKKVSADRGQSASQDSYTPIVISPIVDKSALAKRRRKMVHTSKATGQLSGAKPSVVYATTPNSVATPPKAYQPTPTHSKRHFHAAPSEIARRSDVAAKSGTNVAKMKASSAEAEEVTLRSIQLASVPSSQLQSQQLQERQSREQHPQLQLRQPQSQEEQRQQFLPEQQFLSSEESVTVQLPSGQIARILTRNLPVELRPRSNQPAESQLGSDASSMSQSGQSNGPNSQRGDVPLTDAFDDLNGGLTQMPSFIAPGGDDHLATTTTAASSHGLALPSGNFINIDGQLYHVQDGSGSM